MKGQDPDPQRMPSAWVLTARSSGGATMAGAVPWTTPMTRFFLIRHAANDVSGHAFAGRMAGVRLNEVGRRQAQALAARFAGAAVAAVCSSPLERAVETAEPIATVLGLAASTREELLEMEFGEWTGRRFDALDGDAGFRRFNTLRSCAGAPGGESMLQVQARMVQALEALRVEYAGQAVVVVGHGDPIRAALAHYLGMSLDLMLRLVVDVASVSVVEVDEYSVRVLSINDTGRASFA
jgi:broad specificity phosphatase PhoE